MRTRLVVLLVALALVTGACGGGGGETEIGIKRVALALAFAEEELAEPVAPNVIIQLVPPPPDVQADDLGDFESPAPEVFDNPFACPVAPAGAAAAVPVTFAVTAPPAAGTYLRHNVGTITIEGGVFPITLPYPFISTDEVSEPEVVELPAAPGVEPTEVIEYELRRILIPGFEQTDRYRITDTAIELVRRTTITNNIERVFEPTPTIDVYVFGVEGSTWNDAGVDDASGTAMAFQGKIEKREVIDVCGEVVDTYRVSAQETMLNLRTGETSGTSSDRPNIYNVATQFGGLRVRDDIKTTDTARDPESGSPLVIRWEFVTTLNDTETQ